MTVDNLFCSTCGVAVTNESRYCFKCGSKIQKISKAPSEPYQLDEKFKPRGSVLLTKLNYSQHWRVWLLDEGFERLHEFVNQLCDLAFSASSRVAPSDSQNRCYDTISDIHFPRYDTDCYPIDGYESIFVQFEDSIPSPFGNLANTSDAIGSRRSMRIFMGRIEHDPTHGESNYSETKPPRLRKSKLIEKWGIYLEQRVLGQLRTHHFYYSLNADSLSRHDQYSPNYKGLLAILGIDAVTDRNIKTLPQVIKVLSETDGSIRFQFFYEEEWQPQRGIWQPYLDVSIKTGWLSSESRRIFLEPTKDN